MTKGEKGETIDLGEKWVGDKYGGYEIMGRPSIPGWFDDPALRYHHHLKRDYGIGLSDYDELWEAQGGVCKLCGQAEKKRRLSVDHDHETGQVRGLLCMHCNTGLGAFKDNPKLLDLAAQYLREANTRQA